MIGTPGATARTNGKFNRKDSALYGGALGHNGSALSRNQVFADVQAQAKAITTRRRRSDAWKNGFNNSLG
jgi:hypothetical protein